MKSADILNQLPDSHPSRLMPGSARGRRLRGVAARRARLILGSLVMAILASVWSGNAASRVAWGAEMEPIQLGQPERLEVFPAEFTLQGPRAKIHLVVTAIYADGSRQDVTRIADFQVTHPELAESRENVIHPKANGTTTVEIHVDTWESTTTIHMVDQEKPQPLSFEYDAMVALSKQGCNSGACHGSPSGKGGFRLSLRAFDPVLDELTLIREDYGRRTNPLEPEESLLLQKPLMKVPHGGGLKIRRSDPAYKILEDWIAEGGRSDSADQARCVKIELYPSGGRVLRRPAHTQQLCVLAHFSDGSVRDVTEMAVYESSDEEVAEVDSNGWVMGKDRGEAAIVVRYLEFIESSFLTFIRDVPGYTWTDPPVNNYVDELVHDKLQKLQYLPSELCTDEEFVRRVYLDVIGIPPTIQEVREFLADGSPDKRSRLIDDLLDRPEYAKFWALKWGDLLRLTVGQVGGEGVHKYHRWVERAIESNMPYDQFARELLTASGSTLSNPPANFYRTATDENDCVETVSQVFLGARIQCAKCHNHPFERWTQDNYYGMAAFFNRIQRKKSPRSDELVVWTSRQGEVVQPRTQETMKPWLPGEGSAEIPAEEDRRVKFADWLTQPDNPFFGRIEVNRIWSHLFGRGIVDPPDDFRDSNPPSNAELLDALAEDFAEQGFDRKHVLRTILNSRTYQASFQPNEFNEDDVKYFSHFQPRMLSAEQLLDSIGQTTGVPEQFGGLPVGTRATQLPAPDLVKHEFLKVFGQPERQTVCACERTSESNLGMAIQFFNGPLIYEKLKHAENRFRQLAAAGYDDESIIRQLHLAAVSREPSPAEIEASLQHLEAKREEVAQQIEQLQATVAGLEQQQAELRNGVIEQLRQAKLASVPEVIRQDVAAAFATAQEERSEVQGYLVEKFSALVGVTDEEVTEGLTEAQQEQLASLAKQVTDLRESIPAAEDYRMIALEDICWAVLNTNEFLFQH
jgi:hypothetical protein